MDKAGRERKLWISGLYEYRVTPQSGSIAIAAHNTVHTQGERPTPTTKHLRSPRNASDPTRTHEEAREQAEKELY